MHRQNNIRDRLNISEEDKSIPDVSQNYQNNQGVIEKNVNKIIFAHININSIRNKLSQLTNDIHGKIDILMISETKIDNSFPKSEFIIPGFHEPYRQDRNCHGGGILLYIRDDIPSKEITNSRLCSPSEGFFVEINLRNKKWVICCSYLKLAKNLIYFPVDIRISFLLEILILNLLNHIWRTFV